MAAVIPIVGAVIGSLLVGKALAPKAPKQPGIVPQVQQRANSQVSDALIARRGTRANQRTGSRGAEVGSALKTKLGQ